MHNLHLAFLQTKSKVPFGYLQKFALLNWLDAELATELFEQFEEQPILVKASHILLTCRIHILATFPSQFGGHVEHQPLLQNLTITGTFL